MKTVKFNKISFENFKGQSRDIELTKNNEIRGWNKSGKSTLFNAILWLFLGVDEENRGNYLLFNNKVEQTHENSKTAIVCAEIDIDGNIYNLKKTASIGWTRKKNHSEWERKGSDNYKFYIDDIERNATEYKKFIEEMFCPVEKLKLIMNPRYFLSLDWKVMRKNFEELIGEVSEEDFHGDYSEIENDLKKYPIEEVKKLYRDRLKTVNDNIENLPKTIEILNDNLPDISNIENIGVEIDGLKQQISDIDDKLLSRSKSISSFKEKRNEEFQYILKLKKEYNDAKELYESEQKNEILEITDKINSIDVENKKREYTNNVAMQEFAYNKRKLESERLRLNSLVERRNELRAKNNAVKQMEFKEDKCPFCGQELPDEMLENAKNEFNKKKNSEREKIIQEGKATNVLIEESEKIISQLEGKIKSGVQEEKLESTEQLKNMLEDLKNNFKKYESTEESNQKLEEIKNLEENVTSIPQQDNSSLNNMKMDLINEMQEKSKKLGLKEEYEKQVNKIHDLETVLKKYTNEAAILQGKIDAAINYEREKAEIIKINVNNKFDYIKVEMTETNKSGDIVDTCILKDSENVNATTTNNQSKILCGIDIANAFARKYDMIFPTIIDNAESINEMNYPEFNQQVIKLIVDKCDFKVLNL